MGSCNAWTLGSKAFDGARRTVNFEKVLGVVGTARTWKVVDKLIELVGGGATA